MKFGSSYSLSPQGQDVVVLRYSGVLEERQADMLISWAETIIASWGLAMPPTKKMLRCVIEMVQNISKHARRGEFIVSIGPENRVTFHSRNNVVGAEAEALQRALTLAWKPAFQELRETMRNQRSSGERTKSGGAGLGLLDLRSCADDNVCAECIPCASGSWTLDLKVWFHNERHLWKT